MAYSEDLLMPTTSNEVEMLDVPGVLTHSRGKIDDHWWWVDNYSEAAATSYMPDLER